MSAIIAKAREVIASPEPWWADKLSVIGLLALAVVAGDGTDEEIAEARGIVVAFWQGLRGVA